MGFERFESESPQALAMDHYIAKAIADDQLFRIEGFMVQEGRSLTTAWRDGDDDLGLQMGTGIVFLLLGGTNDQQGASVFVIDTDHVDALIEALQNAKTAPIAKADDPNLLSTTIKFKQHKQGE